MPRPRLTQANQETIDSSQREAIDLAIVRPRLTAVNQKSIDAANAEMKALQKRRQFAEELARLKEEGTNAWYDQGGQLYLDWIQKYYRTHTGLPLHWKEPYLPELCLLFGNPWFADLYIEKAAQMGYTELCVSLSAFSLVVLRAPVGFGVEQAGKLTDLMGPRFQTAFDNIEPIQLMRSRYSDSVGRKDTDTKTRRITVGGVQLTAFYAGVNSTSGDDGGRQASSGMSSFPADLIIADELELWPPASLDIAKKRQEACTMPTRVFRGGSTPGGDGGTLDIQLKASTHLFQWQVECPYCGSLEFIHGFGNFLKPVVVKEDGESETRYVDSVGRPIDWFCHDSSSDKAKEKTAYVGCSQCEEELTFDHMAKGRYVCVKTGAVLTELCEQVTRERTPVEDKCAIRYPKLASFLFNAPKRITELLYSQNPADSLQQGLGITISLGGGKISIEKLLRCVGLERPAWAKIHDFTVLGADQGHAANIVQIQRWYLNREFEDPAKQWRFAFKEIVYFGMVAGGFPGLDPLVEDYEVDYVGIDNEPEVNKAADYAREHPPGPGKGLGQVYLIDEHHLGTGESYRAAQKNVQGDMIPIYRCDRSFILDAVRECIYKARQSFPAGEQYDPRNKASLLYQYHTAERLSDGSWTKPPEPDHFLHADAIATAAALVSRYEPNHGEFLFGGVKR